ncbi:MAG: hypothetical protein L6427_03455 [Actinomycetia bacterium]|nr:hypothetical protein [Actinomycetes bacterium]
MSDWVGTAKVHLRWHYEQMTLQFRPDYILARNVLMFLSPTCDETTRLNNVFIEANGLSIREYLQLAFIVYAGLRNGPDFTESRFTKADIPQLKVELSDKTVTSFLNVLKTDYRQFRMRDEEMNKDLDQLFTKNRYNPLFETPIIEVAVEGIGHGYVVPNVVVYQLKAFGGLFWWFHNYYESKGMDPLAEFRTPFGEVFEQYVGRVIKGIYGEENVHGEIRYGDGRRFIDWSTEVGGKVYLFEAKAYQFALSSRRTGYKDAVLANESKKIMDAIKQVYKRVKDIEVYEELAEFRGKEIIPIIVLLDTPYLWSRFFHKWIKEAQIEMADAEGIPGLRDFAIYLMNIGELEHCDGVVGKVSIEEVLEAATKDVATGFDSILEERLGRPLENRMLKHAADVFFDSIIETE